MFLSDLAVRRFVGVLMATLIVVVLGVVSLSRLPIDLLPSMQLPMVVVATDYPGAAPQEVESMVTRPVEEILSTLGDLRSIASYSLPGNSMVLASFTWGKDMDYAAMEIREKLDLIRNVFPQEVGNPITIQMDPSLLPVMQIGMEGEAGVEKLTQTAEEIVKVRLERIDGVAMITIAGGVYPRITAEIDQKRLAAYGVNLDQIRQALFLENINYMGGELEEGQRLYLVRTLGQMESAEEIATVAVGYNRGGPVTLGEVADVREHLSRPAIISRLDGRENVALMVQKRSDANTVQVARAVHRELQALEKELAGDVHFSVASDQSVFIAASIRSLAEIAFAGGILAAMVIYLFLHSLPATALICCSIPVSLLAAVTLIYFQGSTLNIITLGGLALGVGLMVDNSIVVLENIHRVQSDLADRFKAARFGAGQMFAPITASTLTTVVVFLPVVFIEGITRVIFRPLAFTVTFSLLASLIVAMTLIPSLLARMLRPHPSAHRPRVLLQAFDRGYAALLRRYRAWLRVALRRPYWLAGTVLVLLIASVFLFRGIGAEFIPELDSSEIMIGLKMPAGTPLAETDRVAAALEKQVGEVPEVCHIFTTAGSAGIYGGGGTPEQATLYVLLHEKGERHRSSAVVAESLRQKLAGTPGAEVSVSLSDATGSSYLESGKVQLILKGEDLSKLEELAQEAARRVSTVAGTREVQTSFDEGRPELQLRLDRERAASLGISTPMVATLVETVLQGKLVTRLYRNGTTVEVYLQGNEELRCDSAALRQLILSTAGGTPVPLEAIASFNYDLGPSAIQREDQSRVGYVYAQLAAGYNLGRVNEAVEKSLEGMELPPGYSLEPGGEVVDLAESFTSLGYALLFAVVLVYMILAIQFESLLHPLIIMFTLPQSFTGVTLALVLSRRPLSMPALIGAVLLAGIVVNNGIILVDYINYLRRSRDLSREEAIIEAGTTRFRPILMTTGTTVAGMLPLALGLGSGAEIQAPIAVVIIGGLTFSTLVTLFLVPAAYRIADEAGVRFTAFLAGWKRQIRTKTENASQ